MSDIEKILKAFEDDLNSKMPKVKVVLWRRFHLEVARIYLLLQQRANIS